MAENQDKKTSFWLGLFAGLSITSIIAFAVLFALMWKSNESNSLIKTDATKPAIAAEQKDNNNNMPGPEIKKASPLRDSDHVLGNPDAKVVIVIYSDFECPFCGRHYNTVKEIEKNYGDKVKFVFRHFPLSFHQHAMDAAVASECASDQGKFWEMHDKLFEANQAKRLGEENIFETLAKEIGLNMTQFKNCMANPDAKKQIIQEDMQLGQKDGVQGTPATFVNDKFVSGAYPYDYFAGIIDEELAK